MSFSVVWFLTGSQEGWQYYQNTTNFRPLRTCKCLKQKRLLRFSLAWSISWRSGFQFWASKHKLWLSWYGKLVGALIWLHWLHNLRNLKIIYKQQSPCCLLTLGTPWSSIQMDLVWGVWGTCWSRRSTTGPMSSAKSVSSTAPAKSGRHRKCCLIVYTIGHPWNAFRQIISFMLGRHT